MTHGNRLKLENKINIFYLDKDQYACAQGHLDKHVVKMILEYAQLLSTAHRVLDGVITEGVSATGRKRKSYVISDSREGHLYAATHVNHPSAVWVRKSVENYLWLANMLLVLCEEYTHRYGKTHKVERIGLCGMLRKIVPTNIGIEGWSEPTTAMPDDYKVSGDAITSYRNYYLKDKVRIARWTNRCMPDWFSEGINTLYNDMGCTLQSKPGRVVSMPTYQ
jgi:hypothetical protein